MAQEARESTVRELQRMAGQWRAELTFIERHGPAVWLKRAMREAQHAAYVLCEHEWRREREDGMYGRRYNVCNKCGHDEREYPREIVYHQLLPVVQRILIAHGQITCQHEYFKRIDRPAMIAAIKALTHRGARKIPSDECAVCAHAQSKSAGATKERLQVERQDLPQCQHIDSDGRCIERAAFIIQATTNGGSAWVFDTLCRMHKGQPVATPKASDDIGDKGSGGTGPSHPPRQSASEPAKKDSNKGHTGGPVEAPMPCKNTSDLPRWQSNTQTWTARYLMVATLRGALQEVHEKCARHDAQRPGARRKRSIPTRIYRRLRWLGITRHLGGEQSPPILPAPDARVVSYPWMDIESLSLERHLHDQAPSRAAYEAWMDSTAMCYDSDNKLYVPVATSIMQYASTAYNNAATVYHYNLPMLLRMHYIEYRL